VGTAVRPMPTPTTNVVAAIATTGEVAPSSRVRAVPVSTSAEPTTAVHRNPTRRESRPAFEAEIGHPTVTAASANPATSAPTPGTPCAKTGTYVDRARTMTPTSSEIAVETPSTRRRRMARSTTG